MASDITLSSAVRSNLLSLQNTATLLSKTQEKLSTGLKVNSALDDPTAFFTASGLNSRANDLSRLQDFVSNSVQTLKAADEGITAITKLVESAEATARQALNSAGTSASATGSTDITGDNALAQVDTNTGTVTATAASFDNFTATGTSTGVDFSTLDLDITASNEGTTGLDTQVIGTADNGRTFTITDVTGSNTTADITLETGDDTDAVVTKINNAIAASAITNTDIVASNVGGEVVLTVTNGANARVDDTVGTGQGAGAADAIGFVDATAGGANTNLTGNAGNEFAATGFVSATEDGLTFTISDGTNTSTNITLSQGENAAAIAANITTALSNAGITDIAAADNGGQVSLTSSNGASITVLDTGTVGAAAALDLSQVTQTASNATFTQGDQFQVNGTTLTYGTGAGEFNSSSELTTLLSNIDGVAASINGSNNLVITSTGDDLTIAEVGGTTANDLGLAAVIGTTDAANTLGSSIGDAFSVTIGGTTSTITYGSGSNEVNTRAELTAALEGITGIASASFNTSNQLVVTSEANTSLSFADVTGSPLTELGVADANTVTQSSVGIETGDSFTVQVGSAAASTITFGSATGQVDTRAELVSALNDISNISASITDDGFLSIEATNGEDLTISEGTNTPLSDLGFAGASVGAAISASENTDRTAFATQFNELRSQINQLAADASFNGNNLLAGDSVTVTFNEDSTSTLTVQGVNFNANGLGIDASVNTFQTDGDINAAVSDLETATATLRAQASKFGSNLSVVETRQDFTKELINVLETGAANLTLADSNEEGANLLALQTRQQLSSTSLSLASQADQNVLRLL